MLEDRGGETDYGPLRMLDLAASRFVTWDAERKSLRLHDLEGGAVLQTFGVGQEGETPSQLMRTPDAKWLLIPGPKTNSLWQVEDGIQVLSLDAETVEFHSLTFSPGGSYMDYTRRNTLFAARSPISGNPALPGDVNADREVDVADAVLVLRFIVGAAVPTPREAKAADVTQDSALTVSDVVLLLWRMVGKG